MNKSLKHYAMSPQMMMPWHPGVTISTKRAAELLGCSESTVLHLIEDGRLEAFKRRQLRNSPYIIIRESVVRLADEWRLESGATPSQAPPQSTARSSG